MKAEWKMEIRPAVSADLQAIIGLLESGQLLTDDLDQALANFFVGVIDTHIAATGGLEVYGDIALLRSLVVAKKHRGQKIGANITQTLLGHAKTLGIRRLYLLTRSAEAFFAEHGFDRIERSLAPEAIRQTAQFDELCPADAALMSLTLAK